MDKYNERCGYVAGRESHFPVIESSRGKFLGTGMGT